MSWFICKMREHICGQAEVQEAVAEGSAWGRGSRRCVTELWNCPGYLVEGCASTLKRKHPGWGQEWAEPALCQLTVLYISVIQTFAFCNASMWQKGLEEGKDWGGDPLGAKSLGFSTDKTSVHLCNLGLKAWFLLFPGERECLDLPVNLSWWEVCRN